jgi:hypothetical protein
MVALEDNACVNGQALLAQLLYELSNWTVIVLFTQQPTTGSLVYEDDTCKWVGQVRAVGL